MESFHVREIGQDNMRSPNLRGSGQLNSYESPQLRDTEAHVKSFATIPDDTGEAVWGPTSENIAREEAERIYGLAWLHAASAEYKANLFSVLSYVSIILGLLNGAGLVSTVSERDSEAGFWTTIGFAFLAFVTAGISGILKFRDFTGESAKHRELSGQYNILFAAIQRELILPRSQRKPMVSFLAWIYMNLDNLNKHSLSIEPKMINNYISVLRRNNVELALPEVAGGIIRSVRVHQISHSSDSSEISGDGHKHKSRPSSRSSSRNGHNRVHPSSHNRHNRHDRHSRYASGPHRSRMEETMESLPAPQVTTVEENYQSMPIQLGRPNGGNKYDLSPQGVGPVENIEAVPSNEVELNMSDIINSRRGSFEPHSSSVMMDIATIIDPHAQDHFPTSALNASDIETGEVDDEFLDMGVTGSHVLDKPTESGELGESDDSFYEDELDRERSNKMRHIAQRLMTQRSSQSPSGVIKNKDGVVINVDPVLQPGELASSYASAQISMSQMSSELKMLKEMSSL
jgi:hypothetical protein